MGYGFRCAFVYALGCCWCRRGEGDGWSGESDGPYEESMVDKLRVAFQEECFQKRVGKRGV